MNKKLTIITINYNNLAGLQKTMASIINQTWKEFEYIIIDGGSTDGSEAYIESQSKKIDYWVSEPDKGIYNAMNKGIAKATGEYLLFLNSGDHLYDLKVLEQNHNKITEQDIIYFNLNVVDGNNAFIKEYPHKLPFSYLINDTLPHPATFIKSSLFCVIGMYDDNLKIVSDWKFFIESICKYNSNYLKIDKTLSTFYLDGLSSNFQNKEIIFKEKQEVLRLNFSSYLVDISQLNDSKNTLSNLRKSRKIQVLIKLGLLNKF
jgi:glycosyltransferase involved in cell wall biosynthesis